MRFFLQLTYLHLWTWPKDDLFVKNGRELFRHVTSAIESSAIIFIKYKKYGRIIQRIKSFDEGVDTCKMNNKSL